MWTSVLFTRARVVGDELASDCGADGSAATTHGLAVAGAAPTNALRTARSPLLHRRGRAHGFARAALQRLLRLWGLDDVNVVHFKVSHVPGCHCGVAKTTAQFLQRGLRRGGSVAVLGVG